MTDDIENPLKTHSPWTSSKVEDGLRLRFPDWQGAVSPCYVAGNDIRPMGGLLVRHHHHQLPVQMEALDSIGLRAPCSFALPADRGTLESIAYFLLEIAAKLPVTPEPGTATNV